MFGTLKPCKKDFPKAQRTEYKKYYCGLCFALHRNFGKFSRILLNYDLTGDFLLAESVLPFSQEEEARCPCSLFGRKVKYISAPGLSDYFAAVNYIMVYYKLEDDVLDDNSFIGKLLLPRMQAHMEKLAEDLEQEVSQLKEYLERLHAIEKENAFTPVREPAQLFGNLLQTMVKPDFEDDGDEDVFSVINYWVGVWIYTMDAIRDCLSDSRKNNYNPILAGLDGDALQILRSRKDELLGILRECRLNVLQLLDLYPVYRNKALLEKLFSARLPMDICMYLEVKENELAT